VTHHPITAGIMLEILTSLDNTLLAKWIRLAVTVVPMIYLAGFSRRLGLRVSLLIKVGLSLLVLRAVLDLSASYPELDRFPILGTDDPLHGFYQSFVGGILGLAFLAAGVCAEYYRYVRTRNELNRDRQVLESVLSLLKAGILVRDEEQRVVYLDPSAAGSLGSLAGVEGMVRGEAGAGADAAIQEGRGSQLVHVDQKAFQVAQSEIAPGASTSGSPFRHGGT
jgi:PAS domain-containing protein